MSLQHPIDTSTIVHLWCIFHSFRFDARKNGSDSGWSKFMQICYPIGIRLRTFVVCKLFLLSLVTLIEYRVIVITCANGKRLQSSQPKSRIKNYFVPLPLHSISVITSLANRKVFVSATRLSFIFTFDGF
jgi:hypothetical protein